MSGEREADKKYEEERRGEKRREERRGEERRIGLYNWM